MIGFLSGKILECEGQTVLLNVKGVGYEVFVGAEMDKGLGQPNDSLSLWIYSHIREDQFTLFGFKQALLKKVFMILIGINGVGPKLAMAAVTMLELRELVDAVSMGNAQVLQSVPGIGRKMAERIILELKDKLAAQVTVHEWTSGASDTDLSLWKDLTEALVGLGFSDQKIRNVITLLRSEHIDEPLGLNQLLKLALQKIKSC